ncbi:MAG: hypothetical protein M1824_006613 [Vezdaea acicularis]|nr:MAG: hypothetical protein M1824_006613 [Vezdaea acicularis]
MSSSVARISRLRRSQPFTTSTTQALGSAIIRPLTTRSHQRANSSSSKPSGTSDDSTPLRQQGSAPAATTDTAAVAPEKKPPTKAGRRRGAKDAQELAKKDEVLVETALALPSVPSTHHLHPNDIMVSAFFSQHRPISVTHAIPTTSSANSFSQIFTSRSSSAAVSHFKQQQQQQRSPETVVSTLTNVVNALTQSSQTHHPGNSNNNNHQSRQLTQAEHADLRSAIEGAAAAHPNNIVHNLDDVNPSDVDSSSGVLIGQRYRPFNPPPAPSPLPNPSLSLAAADLPSSTSTKHAQTAQFFEEEERTHQFLATFSTATLPNGDTALTIRDISEVSTSAPFSSSRESEGRISVRERRARRAERWAKETDEGDATVWYTISTKRQRRLKMKKHKYKKLMRRTRNLRRKLDRT